jgi:hypothetical protein
MPVKKPNPEQIEVAKKKLGRPALPIDWKLLDNLFLAGCSLSECSTHFNLTSERLGERILEHYGIYSNEYSAILCEKGHSLLRDAQMKKALKGDNTMLVWLGKNKLKQRDAPEDQSINIAINTQFEALQKQIENYQSSRKIDDNTINKDSKS